MQEVNKYYIGICVRYALLINAVKIMIILYNEIQFSIMRKIIFIQLISALHNPFLYSCLYVFMLIFLYNNLIFYVIFSYVTLIIIYTSYCF